jgi:4-amino-4-deoxy-L-arabinose transferase-like glycosyltransferase
MTIVVDPIPAVSEPHLKNPVGPDTGSSPHDAGAGGGAEPARALLRWWRPADRPAWSVPTRAALFGMTALLYTWGLARIGMGNTFYAAAVKSGTESWKAFFFGSLDPGSFITVDKPPAALWVMELSGRIFGFSSWSMLAPEALAGVATVMVLYHLVRRWFGEPAAVLASLALALTPVAVVIFRYNDPDAFLTLLLVLAGWACWRSIETGKTNGLVLCGALVGLAFLTKTLDAFIVVPALGLAYLWCGPPRLARRIGQLGWAALALLVSSGWWVAIVELWPKSARPSIGGSTDNSELNLIFGYNGFARIFGSGGGAGTAGGTSGSSAFGGGEGLLRMFDSELGGQISWLLPVAIVGLVAGLWLTRRHVRADGESAGFVLWGGTLLMFLAVYDYAKGIFHPYYTVVMAPAVAALAGAGAVALWRLGRQSRRWAWVLPATIVGTVLWADALLARTSGYDSWLGPTVVVTGLISALILFFYMVRPKGTRWFALLAGALAATSVLAGPAAYSLTTIGTTTSAIATAGPTSGAGGIGGGGGPGGGAGPGGGSGPGGTATTAARTGMPTGARTGTASGAPSGIGSGGGVAGGGGGASSVNESLVRYLEKHQGSATYLVAVNGSQSAAPFILESGKAVIAMGGFGGTDPAPTLTEFKHLVATGKVHYVYVSGGMGSAGGASASGFGFGDGGGTPPGGGRTTARTTAAKTTARSAGGQHSTAGAIDAWVEKYGTKVSSSAYDGSSGGGTLYFVSSSAASK